MTASRKRSRSVREIDEANERDLACIARRIQKPAGAAATKLPLRILVASDLTDTHLPPTRFVIEPIIPQGQVTLLSGHGGAGKSTLALTLAAHVACGSNWNELRCTAGRVVFVSLEDSAELVGWRLRAICQAYGLDWGQVSRDVVIADGSETDDAALAREHRVDGAMTVQPTASMSQLPEVVAGAALIVIDNASDAADLDEINRQRVRAFMRMLVQLARDAGAGVLLLAHIDKHSATRGRAGNTFSGSTAWHNSARSRIALIEVGDGAVELVHEKANFSARAAPLRLHFIGRGVLMLHDDKLCEPSSEARQADINAVFAALSAAQAAGRIVPPGRSGASNAYSVLSNFGLRDFMRGPGSRERFWRALETILSDELAQVVEYRTKDFKIRKHIVRTEPPKRLSADPPEPPAESAGGATAESRVAAESNSAAIERIGGVDRGISARSVETNLGRCLPASQITNS